MSTAHYAHLNFGNFSDSEKDANKNINQKSNKSNGKTNDLMQSITREDILELLDRLDIQKASGMQTNRARLGKIPMNHLRQRLKDMGAATNGKKVELQERLFKMLLGRDVELTATSSVIQNTDQGIAIKNDDLVWNKGAWLSFLASIEDQQEYLGPLTLIW
jgi:hypothetical protein